MMSDGFHTLDAKQLRLDGFVLVEQVLDPSVVKLLRTELTECRRGADVGRAQQWHRSHWARSNPSSAQFLVGAPLGWLAVELLGTAHAWVYEDTFIAKEAYATQRVPWHQDQSYYPIRCDDLVVTLWAALDDVPLDAGPVCYVPRSHQWENRFEPVEFDSGRPIPVRGTEPLSPSLTTDHIQVPCRAGDVIAHYGTTVHGSGPNLTANSRRALAVSYLSELARFEASPMGGSHPCRPLWDHGEPLPAGLARTADRLDLDRG